MRTMSDYIFMMIVVLVAMVTVRGVNSCVSPTVPASLCDCEEVGEVQNILCKFKSLTEIPQFTNTGITYGKLDFSSSQTGSCVGSACNNITTINANAFENISVVEIDLRKNPISSVSDYAFVGQSNLKTLSMEGDKSGPPPYGALDISDITTLENLYLGSYKETTVNKTLLFPTLKTLTLENFKDLSSITVKVFDVLKLSLKKLTLSDLPSMTELPIPTLKTLGALTTLEIKGTHVVRILGETFSLLNNLTELSLTQNSALTTLDTNALDGIKNTLTHLILKANHLQQTSSSSLDFLDGTWNVLSHLDLSYNVKLGDIPANTFNTLQGLEYLILQEIGMTTIVDGAFNSLDNLHTVDLSYYMLTSLDDGVFQGTPNLVELKINNQLSTGSISIHPNAFQGIEGLQKLLLEFNTYNNTELWDLVAKLPNVTELNLESLGLTEIPDKAFRYNVKLEKVFLSINNISEINQATFFGPKSTLRDIEIRNNKITTVDSCVLYDFPYKPTLALFGNPLHCDCALKWLHDWVYNQVETDLAAILVGVCVTPEALRGKHFTDFNSSALCPDGFPIPSCPDLYATTTTTTSTTTTPSSTTTKSTEAPRIETPTFTLTVLDSGVDYVLLTWLVHDETHLVDVKLGITDYPEKDIYLSKNTKEHTFHKLDPQRSYNFCLTLNIDGEYRSTDMRCESGSTKAPMTTTTEAVTEAPQSNIAVIVGASAGGFVFVILIIVILCVLLKANSAQNKKLPPTVHAVSYQSGNTLPRAGEGAKRFAKKPQKESATPDDIEVKIISNGDMAHKGRISAGSYQCLNEKGVNGTPMPSSSKDGYVNANLSAGGHYTNAVEDRPLPKAPNGSKYSSGANGHGYVNDGFTKRPETSSNEYSDISEGKWI